MSEGSKIYELILVKVPDILRNNHPVYTIPVIQHLTVDKADEITGRILSQHTLYKSMLLTGYDFPDILQSYYYCYGDAYVLLVEADNHAGAMRIGRRFIRKYLEEGVYGDSTLMERFDASKDA